MPPNRRKSLLGFGAEVVLQPSLLCSLTRPTESHQLPAWAARVRERLTVVEVQLRRLEREKQALLGQLLNSPADLVDVVLSTAGLGVDAACSVVEANVPEMAGSCIKTEGDHPHLWKVSRGVTSSLPAACTNGKHLHPGLRAPASLGRPSVLAHVAVVPEATAGSKSAGSLGEVARAGACVVHQEQPNGAPGLITSTASPVRKCASVHALTNSAVPQPMSPSAHSLGIVAAPALGAPLVDSAEESEASAVQQLVGALLESPGPSSEIAATALEPCSASPMSAGCLSPHVDDVVRLPGCPTATGDVALVPFAQACQPAGLMLHSSPSNAAVRTEGPPECVPLQDSFPPEHGSASEDFEGVTDRQEAAGSEKIAEGHFAGSVAAAWQQSHPWRCDARYEQVRESSSRPALTEACEEKLCTLSPRARLLRDAGLTNPSAHSSPPRKRLGERSRSPSLAMTVVESSEDEGSTPIADIVARIAPAHAPPSCSKSSSSSTANSLSIPLPWLQRPRSPCKARATSSLLERIQRRQSGLSIEDDSHQMPAETLVAVGDCRGRAAQEARVDVDPNVPPIEQQGIGPVPTTASRKPDTASRKPADTGSFQPELLSEEALKGWMLFFGMKAATSRAFMVKRLQEIESYLGRSLQSYPPAGSIATASSSASGSVAAPGTGIASASVVSAGGVPVRGCARHLKRALTEIGEEADEAKCIKQSPKAARAVRAAEKADALEQALTDAIRSDKELYERLLLFEPLDLAEIRDRLARNNEHPELAAIGEQRLRSFLDSQGVIFASSWNQGARKFFSKRRF